MALGVTNYVSMKICAIYNPYVKDTTITFEEQEVSVDEMRQRITDVSRSLPWLVCEVEGGIAGYAYATRWWVRAASDTRWNPQST